MIHDPIVEEIREARRRHAEKFGNNLEKIYKDLKSMQSKSGRKAISRQPKKYLRATGT